MKPYRLGLDIGTNSIGWFIVYLDDHREPIALGPGGVRIYPDGRDRQSGTSNAVDRRMARSARKRRDRFLNRQRQLMEKLVEHGLMPSDVKARKALQDRHQDLPKGTEEAPRDPLALRARALTERLEPYEVGRALFHLNQRRGFKSNRRSDAKSDESGPIREASSKLATMIRDEGARTLGEFLHRRHILREPVRARNRGGAKIAYDFYPTREMVEAEFDAIWEAQAQYHPSMTPDAKRAIGKEEIFYQRKLKAPQVGKCSLSPAKDKNDLDGYRAPTALPIAQLFRMAQVVRDLRYQVPGQPVTPIAREEGDKVLLALKSARQLSFDKIRALLKLPSEARFTHESERREALDGDETAERLAKKDRFGKDWFAFDLEKQTKIVRQLLNDDLPDSDLVGWLQQELGVNSDKAIKIVQTPLPDGYSRLGLRALNSLVPLMIEEGLSYTQAAERCFGSHSQKETGEILDRLPYYGRWMEDAVVGTSDPSDTDEKRYGKVTNPTVHIGLNQVRRLLNAIVKRHGSPEQIVVELTRDLKLSPKQKEQIEREQRDNQKKNEARKTLLAQNGFPGTGENLARLRLWEEQKGGDAVEASCPFTGERIGIARLMSEEVEIEHLIPFSESWDDSAANKIVCLRYANRHKGKRTPFAAFGSSPLIDGVKYEWSDIANRASLLPRNKRWRFAPDAMERFKEQDGFLARQLNETGWLARMAKRYVGALTDPNQVWVLPGKLTAMIRGKWGLNGLLPDHNYADAKNRLDHRHHAIDALVVALTDRALLQKMSRAYDDARDKIVIPEPWPTLREDLKLKLDKMTVSHRPDHGVGGRLHEETAYGFARNAPNDQGNLVYRKAFTALNENEIGRIRDLLLRGKIIEFVKANKSSGKLDDVLRAFAEQDARESGGQRAPIRHIRLLKSEKPDYLVKVRDDNDNSYKAYSAGSNLFVDVYALPDGTWNGEVVTVFQAHQKGFRPKWLANGADAKLAMRLHKGDLISLEHEGNRQIMLVHRLDAAAGRFKLAAHNEAGELDKRHDKAKSPNDPFRWLMASYNTLKRMNAYQVRVDELGFVWRVNPEELERRLRR